MQGTGVFHGAAYSRDGHRRPRRRRAGSQRAPNRCPSLAPHETGLVCKYSRGQLPDNQTAYSRISMHRRTRVCAATSCPDRGADGPAWRICWRGDPRTPAGHPEHAIQRVRDLRVADPEPIERLGVPGHDLVQRLRLAGRRRSTPRRAGTAGWGCYRGSHVERPGCELDFEDANRPRRLCELEDRGVRSDQRSTEPSRGGDDDAVRRVRMVPGQIDRVDRDRRL
jgi:hypothetical protein